MEIDGDMLEEILEAIHSNGRKIDGVRRKVRALEQDLHSIRGTLEIIISSFKNQGTEIETIKTQCNKRAEVCTEAFSRIRAEITGNGDGL
jgi:predicted  nucleic acid-binding Zn-ribbon protein